MRKLIAGLLFVVSFFVTFFDNLYKLRDLEWVPNVLGPALIVASMYIWNPKWLQRRRGRDEGEVEQSAPE